MTESLHSASFEKQSPEDQNARLEFHFLIGKSQPLGGSKTPLRPKKDRLSFSQFTKKNLIVPVPDF